MDSSEQDYASECGTDNRWTASAPWFDAQGWSHPGPQAGHWTPAHVHPASWNWTPSHEADWAAQRPQQTFRHVHIAELHHAGAALATSDEAHVAQVQFAKTYQVLSEAIAFQPGAFSGACFLDLGCAPGGFASRLLEELGPGGNGFGVTMPMEAGGFPILFESECFSVQQADLMSLAVTSVPLVTRSDSKALMCPARVDIVLADAQDLSRRTGRGMHELVRGERRKGLGRALAEVQGVGAVCTLLGIWALTLQELALGFDHLAAGGTFFFRFGWRGKGADEELWYREATHRLFAVVFAFFDSVAPFKSEFSHQADSTFYVIATGFRRNEYDRTDLAQKLTQAVELIGACQDHHGLPTCMDSLVAFVTPDARLQIASMLETVSRLRQIGMASRSRVEAGSRGSLDAALWISPVPYSLTMPRLKERLERFGRVTHMRRRAHAVGVGADALVQFAQPAHAASALEAIGTLKILGPNITARRASDNHKGRMRICEA